MVTHQITTILSDIKIGDKLRITYKEEEEGIRVVRLEVSEIHQSSNDDHKYDRHKKSIDAVRFRNDVRFLALYFFPSTSNCAAEWRFGNYPITSIIKLNF